MYSIGQPSVEKKAKEEEIISDLSRRNTIVAPAPLEQLENDIEDGMMFISCSHENYHKFITKNSNFNFSFIFYFWKVS